MLIQYLKTQNIFFEQDRPLTEMTTFRIGGKAKLVVYPDTIEKLANTVRFLNQNHLDYFVMGNGSNLLFSDNEFVSPIIKTDRLTEMSNEGNTFTFGSGVKMVNAANFAASLGYSGMEFAHGIPGSIGGAVYMNAGAYDGAMSQIVTKTTYVDDTGDIKTVVEDEHDFSYRHSFFSHKNLIIAQTVVELTNGNVEDIRAKMADLMQRRKDKQPLNLPSAGSTFKRPEGAFAGKLIDDCGLRGYQIGGARVSDKHCGFIVNQEGATFEDVMSLIEFVQKTVMEKTGYFLECEVEIIK